MLPTDTVQQMDCFTAMNQIPDEGVDIVLTDPPYPNGMRLFQNSILDGYAALYVACKKVRNCVVFFWNPSNVPLPPRGWYEVARHVWHKPDCRTTTTYEVIVVWSKDYRRLSSRVWSIPILDYRSLKDWNPHPTQKPVKLIRYLLDLYTNEGDLVLDPFVGSGSTAVACKQMRRHFLAVDNDASYVAIANNRLRERTMPEALPSPPPRQDDAIAEGFSVPEDLPDDAQAYDDASLDAADSQSANEYQDLPSIEPEPQRRPAQPTAPKRPHHNTRTPAPPERRSQVRTAR